MAARRLRRPRHPPRGRSDAPRDLRDPRARADETLRRRRRRRRPGSHRRARPALRVPRTQRRREDHDDPHGPRVDPAQRRRGRAVRRAGAAPTRAPLERVGALVEEPAFWKYLSGRKNLEYFARPGAGTDRAGDARPARPGRPRPRDGRSHRRRRQAGEGLQPGDAPAPRPRARAARRAGAARARRADERPRPDRDARDARAPAAPRRRRHDDLRLEPPAGRGRGDVRPGRRDGARASRRGGTAVDAPRWDRSGPRRGRRRRDGAPRG